MDYRVYNFHSKEYYYSSKYGLWWLIELHCSEFDLWEIKEGENWKNINCKKKDSTLISIREKNYNYCISVIKEYMGKHKSSKEHIPDNSIQVHQKQKIKNELNIRQRKDLTETQKQIIEAALDKEVKCIILDGVAGSGKTFISILCSLMLLNEKKVSQMVYIRSLIQAKDGETGFLSGNLEEKTQYFNEPMYQILDEILPKAEIDHLIKDGRVMTYPTSMLRSYNFHNTVIIGEECQNYSWDSIFSTLTRVGMFSKLFLIGDSIHQNDLGTKSGFGKCCSIFSSEEARANGFRFFKLTSQDIVRSPFVKFVVEQVEKYNTNKK